MNVQIRKTLTTFANKFEGKNPNDFSEKEVNDFSNEIENALKDVRAYTRLDVELKSLFPIEMSAEDKELRKLFELKHNSALFIIADKEKANKYAGFIRAKLGESLELIDNTRYEFCIINDFQMYEYNEETGAYDFTHNPFTMPQGGMDSLMNKKTDEILAYQYDFVCNGLELASGGVRNYSVEILKKAFELAEQKDTFQQLMEAFAGDNTSVFLKKELGAAYPYFNYLRRMSRMEGVQALMPYEFDIR